MLISPISRSKMNTALLVGVLLTLRNIFRTSMDVRMLLDGSSSGNSSPFSSDFFVGDWSIISSKSVSFVDAPPPPPSSLQDSALVTLPFARPFPPQQMVAIDHDQNDNNTLSHPHAGAVFENGTQGMVVNPSPLRMDSFRQQQSTNCLATQTFDTGALEILEKVHKGVVASQQANQQVSQIGGEQVLPRILCMVYTYDDHGGPHTQSLQAIVDTWGKRCDGFLAASNVTDHSVGAINLLHLGPEEYGNMWQKIRSMWAYAYDNYLEDFDYFHICGDDVYLVVDNLRAYLNSPEVQKMKEGHVDIFAQKVKKAVETADIRPRPLLIGMPLHSHHTGFGTRRHPLGGPGYALNKASLKLLVEQGLPNDLVDNIDPREDIFIGGIMEKLGILTADTRDEYGSWRYGESAEFHASIRNSLNGFWQPKKMMQKYAGKNLTYWDKGVDFLSAQTVSFHLKQKRPEGVTAADQMYRYDDILYRNDLLCDTKLTS